MKQYLLISSLVFLSANSFAEISAKAESCNGRRIMRLVEKGEQAVHKDDKLGVLEVLNSIQREARSCRPNNGLDPDDYTNPANVCTFYYNDPQYPNYTNELYSDSNINITKLRKIENGSRLEILEYPNVYYNGKASSGVKVRVISNPYISENSAVPGEILYFYKILFDQRCKPSR